MVTTSREERLVQLVAKWRDEACTERAKSREINERLRRGETVRMTASAFSAIDGFVQFVDHREICANELEAALRESAPPGALERRQG